MHTVSWITDQGELERGALSLLTTNVTTDHASSSAPGGPPRHPPRWPQRPRGGGDDHLPDRRDILIHHAAQAGTILLAAVALLALRDLARHLVHRAAT